MDKTETGGENFWLTHLVSNRSGSAFNPFCPFSNWVQNLELEKWFITRCFYLFIDFFFPPFWLSEQILTKRVVVLFLCLGFLDAWIHSFSLNDLIVQIVKVHRNVEESVGFKKNPVDFTRTGDGEGPRWRTCERCDVGCVVFLIAGKGLRPDAVPRDTTCCWRACAPVAHKFQNLAVQEVSDVRCIVTTRSLARSRVAGHAV